MTSALYVQTRKEVRALLPWAVGVGVATTALALWAARDPGFPGFRYQQQIWVLLIHAAGLLTVAALSMGQEITHRTLPSLLMQPVDRRRVLWTKMAVLAAVAATLGFVGDLMIPRGWSLRGEARLLLVWGPPLVAVGLVPLLTLLTRKPLGGAVFAVVIPGVILMVVERLDPTLDDAHALTITWYGAVIASVCGLAALAYAFPRVETAGDDGLPGSWSSRAAQPAAAPFEAAVRSAPRRRLWLWLAIKNELRLQQLTLAVSALFVLFGSVIVVLQRTGHLHANAGVGALAALHGLFIAVIAGSRASAEERHLGVADTQALQPKAAWKSWAVKVTVTVGLALALSVVMPWLFTLVNADAVRGEGYAFNPAVDWFGLTREYFASVVLAAVAALYVSSLSSNSLWALLACFPAGVAVVSIVGTMTVPMRFWLMRFYRLDLYSAVVTPAMRKNYRDPGWLIFRAKQTLSNAVERDAFIVLIVGLGLLLLYLASRNHRSLERGHAVVIRQIGVIALYLAVATVLFVAADRLAWWLG